MGKQNSIALNGKSFDVITGLPIGKTVDQSVKHSDQLKYIDGVRRTSVINQNQMSTKKDLKLDKSSVFVKHLGQNSGKVHLGREHTKTLMRSSVSRPKSVGPKSLATRLDADNKAIDPSSGIISLTSKIVANRYRRAKDIPKNKHISRFKDLNSEPTLVKKTAVLDVQTQSHQTPSSHITPLAELSVSPASDLFTKALAQANSHEQKLSKSNHSAYKANKKSMTKKIVNIGAPILIVVLLGGFIAYQNVTNIAMRAAVSKAGIHASLPGYSPSGFAISRQIKATPGQIVINLHSNSDDRNFSISQTASNWNSQTLLNDYVATKDQGFEQHNQANGKTIFTYGDANATWVDGGIWYKIEGNSTLNSDQLLKIANSF